MNGNFENINKNRKDIFITLPDKIKNLFNDKGVNCENILLSLKTDIDANGNFCDVYICVTSESIHILNGKGKYFKKKTPEKTKIKDNAETLTDFEESGYGTYKLQDLSDFLVEEYISNGKFTAKFKDELLTLFSFSFTYKADIHNFKKYTEKIKENVLNGGKGEFEPEKDTQEGNRCPKCGNYYPDAQRKICPHCMDKARISARLFMFITKYKIFIAVILSTLLISTGISVFLAYINGKVLYDDVLKEGGKYYGQIKFLLFFVISIEIVSRLIGMVFGIITAKIAALVTYDLKNTIFESFQKLSMKFFSSRQTGGLMNQLNSDANSIYYFLCDGLPYFIINVIKIVIALGIMLYMSYSLTLIVLIFVPIFLFAINFLINLLEKLYARQFSRSRAMNSVLVDSLQGVRVVKAFSKEKKETERFTDRSDKFTSILKTVQYTETSAFPLLFFLIRLSYYVVWLIGGWFVIRGEFNFTYGILMTFFAYLGYLLDPLGFFADMSRWWAHVVNSVQRLFEIMDATPDVMESLNPVQIKSNEIKGKIEFKNVEFSYEKNRKIIDNVSFDIDGGGAIGIVGHTGAGKSTLANLLTRLYDVDGGEILIDGVNVKNLTFKDLHDMISIVSQETYLFVGTIADNIRYAKQDATNEEIMVAAKIASAHDFIMKLPDGYQTQIGRGHKDLSGGERQRLSIARAVLKNPKILIMDEATAAMDTETERQIQNALSNLVKGRTTIMIAHRLSTLRDVDRLLVIQNGKMTESGTHAELIKKKGEYYNLYKMQAQALHSIGIEVTDA